MDIGVSVGERHKFSLVEINDISEAQICELTPDWGFSSTILFAKQPNGPLNVLSYQSTSERGHARRRDHLLQVIRRRYTAPRPGTVKSLAESESPALTDAN